MSEAIKQIVGEFEKPIADIPSDVMDAIKNSRLDLSLNIPNPQMLVSKGLACMHTRKLFVCHWSAWCKEKFSLFWYRRRIPE